MQRNNRNTIFAITGPLESGKDTFGAELMRQLEWDGRKATREFFAEPIKAAAAAIFGWSMADMDNPVFKATEQDDWDFTPRKVLQTLGTEWGREIMRDDLWLKIMHKKISYNQSKGVVTVITDLRFPNESEFVREMGAQIIHISSPNAFITNGPRHASEQGLPVIEGDVHYVNDKTRGMRPMREFIDANFFPKFE